MTVDLRQLAEQEHLPLSLNGAREFLDALLATIDLLDVFRACFPEEFEQALAHHLPIFPSGDQAYSRCECQFFRLVDRWLFPLPLDYLLDDPFGERFLAYHIPIDPLGFDFSGGDNPQEYSPGWQVLMYLDEIIDEDLLKTALEEDAEALVEGDHLPWKALDASLLTLRAKAQGEPLAWLPLAIDMLNNDTESIWLNVTIEMRCDDAEWSRADVEELHRQYVLSQEIKSQADQFVAWLEVDLPRRSKLVLRLWNACSVGSATGQRSRRAEEKEHGPLVRTMTAEAFVRHGTLQERYRGERWVAYG